MALEEQQKVRQPIGSISALDAETGVTGTWQGEWATGVVMNSLLLHRAP